MQKFFLPNEVFLLGLSAGELAVYSFLKRCENHRTRQCWPSIRTIGKAVRMSENTARKYIRQLEERGLITTEPTEVISKHSGRRNGNLLFTFWPIQDVIDQYYDCQMPDGGIGVGHRVPACSRTTARAGKPRVTACGPRLQEGRSPCPSQRVQAGFRPLFPPSWNRTLPSGSSLRGMKRRAG